MTDPSPPRTLLGWVLPFVLVSTAVALHWWLDVPNGPLPPPVQKEGEAPKKPAPKKPAASSDDDDKDKDVDEPFTTPRTPGLLTQLWEAYDPQAFDREPTFEVWNTAHKPRITQLVTSARLQLFKGRAPPPSISVSNIECHTVRCRFTLTTNDQADLQSLVDALEGLRLDGATVWHKFIPDDIVEEPAKREGAPPRFKATILASFIRDLPPVDQLTFKDGAPIRPLTPTPMPTPSIPDPTLPGPSTTTTTPSTTTTATNPGTGALTAPGTSTRQKPAKG